MPWRVAPLPVPAPLCSIEVAFDYRFPIDSLLRQMKFRRRWPLARTLAAAAGIEVNEYLLSFDLMVPVPLHWQRGVIRGFNPASECAFALSRASGVGYQTDALRRTRPTLAQTTLGGSERRSNVAGAFEALRPLEGLTILLIDDVVTTGSTLAAAAAACNAAGAQAVGALAVAAAEPPGSTGLKAQVSRLTTFSAFCSMNTRRGST